jgi:nucleoside-diphosphate-sugar epimerase
MKILVTGADSFVGSYLIPQLLSNSHELFLIGADVILLNKKYNSMAISYVDLEQEKLSNSIKEFNPEAVIHLAAFSTPNDEISDFLKLIEANIIFLGKVLEALKPISLKLFVNTGSFAEYFQGNDELDPAYLYTATKNAARYIVKYYAASYDFKFCTVCPYSLYGGVDTRKKIMDFLFESLDAQQPTDTTSGKQILDFIHVDDLVSLYLGIINNIQLIENNTTFHAGTGEGHTLKDVVRYMEKYTGEKANVNWGGRNYRKRDVMYAVADTTLQAKTFNWKAKIKLEDGVKSYIKANKGKK